MADFAAADRGEELRLQGNEEFCKKNYGEAERFYTLSLEARPNNHLVHGNRSAARLHLDRPEDALADADEALRLDPTYMKGYHRRASALQAMGDLEGVVNTYEAAVQAVPGGDEWAEEQYSKAKRRYANFLRKQQKSVPRLEPALEREIRWSVGLFVDDDKEIILPGTYTSRVPGRHMGMCGTLGFCTTYDMEVIHAFMSLSDIVASSPSAAAFVARSLLDTPEALKGLVSWPTVKTPELVHEDADTDERFGEYCSGARLTPPQRGEAYAYVMGGVLRLLEHLTTPANAAPALQTLAEALAQLQGELCRYGPELGEGQALGHLVARLSELRARDAAAEPEMA
ncbi:unnamed protein product, partial [Heterosigma akashiwo]